MQVKIGIATILLTEDDKRWLALSPKDKKFLLKVLDAKLESEE